MPADDIIRLQLSGPGSTFASNGNDMNLYLQH